VTRRTKTSILLVAAIAAGAGLGLYRLHQPGLAKGGVGLIGTDAFVTVGGERNRIQWREGEIIHHWVGKPRAQPETVCFDGHQVHPASWAGVFSRRGFLIRFLPNRVDVIDLEKLKGEYYSPRTQ
jgi:hypothetical protein